MDDIIKRMDITIETEIFHLSYSKAQEISTKIDELLTPSLGTMKFDDRSNKIVVSDVPKKIKEIRALIAAFDQKHRD